MALKPRMDALTLAFSVEHFIGRRLTESGANWQERDANETFCDSVAEKICEELRRTVAGGQTQGVRAVFQTITELRIDTVPDLYEPAPATKPGEDWVLNFSFEPSWSGDASPGGGASIGRIIQDERHRPGFLRKLRDKAKKRRELPRERQSKPFVVAVENREIELLPHTVLSSLTGTRHQIPHGEHEDSTVPQRVEEARARGWADLLKAWSYIDSPSMRLADYGVFGSGTVDWATDLSAVLVSHHGGAVIQWLPNPFAASAISDARLTHLGFGLDALGAPPPEAYWGARGPHASL